MNMIQYETLTSTAKPQEYVIIPYILISAYNYETNILVGTPLWDEEEYYYSVT